MLLGILLVLQILVCLALIGVVLLQRSEGGALGMGGGPTGFMSARGAGNVLSQMTWILGGVFFALSLAITLISTQSSGGSALDRLNVEALDPSQLSPPPAAAPAATVTTSKEGHAG
ncbi:MAG TPA: preprotein translocase subunit SecG, partial [Phenylobacterium sp.]|nr:preprotein translocase subunit SecG [Phenylobacterium sp.]